MLLSYIWGEKVQDDKTIANSNVEWVEKSEFNPDLSNFKLQALSTELHAFHEKERGYICSVSATTYQGHHWIKEWKSARVLVVNLQWQAAGTGVRGMHR